MHLSFCLPSISTFSLKLCSPTPCLHECFCRFHLHHTFCCSSPASLQPSLWRSTLGILGSSYTLQSTGCALWPVDVSLTWSYHPTPSLPVSVGRSSSFCSLWSYAFHHTDHFGGFPLHSFQHPDVLVWSPKLHSTQAVVCSGTCRIEINSLLLDSVLLRNAPQHSVFCRHCPPTQSAPGGPIQV